MRPRRWLPAAIGAGLVVAAAGAARADLTVGYRATRSELVLFNQTQEAPFARIAYTLYLKGTRVRTEFVDHFGRTSWIIAERAGGPAWGLDPESATFWRLPSSWSCHGTAEQVAQGMAELLQSGGIQSLLIGKPTRERVLGHQTERLEVRFSGRVLGAPQPVAATLTLCLPLSEARAFGNSAEADLYCGKKPKPDVWSDAFSRHLGLAQDESALLGRLAGLPLRLELETDLGIGRARLVLDAAEIKTGTLPDALFAVPAGFTERK